MDGDQDTQESVHHIGTRSVCESLVASRICGKREHKGWRDKLFRELDQPADVLADGEKVDSSEDMAGESKRMRGQSDSPSERDTYKEAKSLVEAISKLSSVEKVVGIKPDLDERKTMVRKSARGVAELAKIEDNVDEVVRSGAVQVLVPLLSLPSQDKTQSSGSPFRRRNSFGSGSSSPRRTSEDLMCSEVAKEAALALGLLAVKPDHQDMIADAGALPLLIQLLKVHGKNPASGLHGSTGGVLRRAADTITNLAHENVSIKNRVRHEGGIKPLISLLESEDPKVQRAAAGALRTLAFKNEDNKDEIVKGNALSKLIFMLKSPDSGIHYEAVGVLGNLVHSTKEIKLKVLKEGALQPVIGLLSSNCMESRREAALLLGQFATTPDSVDYKKKIAQRGALPLLIKMLDNTDPHLKEMAAFALGRLAQNTDNQAGICQAGGLLPILGLLSFSSGNVQHNAAFALYGLADNEDNVPEIIRQDGVRLLRTGNFMIPASQECVEKTIKRLEDKLNKPRVLSQLLYWLRCDPLPLRNRLAMSIAYLCSRPAEENEEKDRDTPKMHSVFIEKRGLNLLHDMLCEAETAEQQIEIAEPFFRLAKKIGELAKIDSTEPPLPSTERGCLGERFVNSETLSDISFLIEDKTFYAHRIALLASSEAFRAMFEGPFKEKDSKNIPIPNISWEIFEAMMKFVYANHAEVPDHLSRDLLQAADQYLLEGLRVKCEENIMKELSCENFAEIAAFAAQFNAQNLRKAAWMYALEHVEACINARGEAEFHEFITDLKDEILLQMQEMFEIAHKNFGNRAMEEAESSNKSPVGNDSDSGDRGILL